MKCRILVCPICAICGHTMHFGMDSVSCVNSLCSIYDKKFKRPTVELEEM